MIKQFATATLAALSLTAFTPMVATAGMVTAPTPTHESLRGLRSFYLLNRVGQRAYFCIERMNSTYECKLLSNGHIRYVSDTVITGWINNGYYTVEK